MPKVKKITFLILTFYLISVAVHLLVILKVIPYYWINGGLSESYESQTKISILSMVVIIGLGIFCWKLIKTRKSPSNFQMIFLYIITFFWVISLIMQLAGTNFERYFMSLVLLLGIVSHLLLIKFLRNLDSHPKEIQEK